MRYLDAVSLAKLRNLRLVTRRHRAEGYLSGRHRSVQHGFSQEFAQHREYVPGDELKYLDWKIYARKDRYVVKQFQEDKSLGAYMLVDASGSMAYRGSGLSTKWEYACRLTMALGYLVLAQGDAAGLITFDKDPRDFLPPRRQLTHLELISETLEKNLPQQESDLSLALLRAAGLIRHRSLIIVISDLLGEPESVLKTLTALRTRKHGVYVIQVLDPIERDLSYDGPVRFESLETGQDLRCEASLVRGAYRREFENQLRLYDTGLHRAAIPHFVAYTDSPWDRSLSDFLGILEKVG